MNRGDGTLKRILAVGAPLLISQMSQYLMTLADTAMVGRLGAVSLAAISIGSTTTWLLFVFVWPVSVGVQAVVSRRFGRNESRPDDTQALAPVLGAGVVYTFFASLLALSLSLAAAPVFQAILSEPAVARGAVSYLRIIRWCVPLIGLGGSIQGFMNSMRRTRMVMAITVGSNALNIFLNWVLIFGRLGAPAMGLEGAALSTLISQVVQAVTLWLMFALAPSLSKYRKERLKPEKGLVKRVTLLSLPIAIQNGVAIFIILSFDTMVENLGTVYLAVTQIVFSFFRINKTVVGGFARGAGILAGNSLGAGDQENARRVTLIQQGIGIVIGIMVMLTVLLIPEKLVRIFSDDPEVLQLGIKALRFFAAFYFVEISAFSLEIIFQSVGWSKFVLFSEFTTNILFLFGASLLLVTFTDWGIWGAWTGFAMYQVGHALILGTGWLSGRWLKVSVE